MLLECFFFISFSLNNIYIKQDAFRIWKSDFFKRTPFFIGWIVSKIINKLIM